MTETTICLFRFAEKESLAYRCKQKLKTFLDKVERNNYQKTVSTIHKINEFLSESKMYFISSVR